MVVGVSVRAWSASIFVSFFLTASLLTASLWAVPASSAEPAPEAALCFSALGDHLHSFDESNSAPVIERRSPAGGGLESRAYDAHKVSVESEEFRNFLDKNLVGQPIVKEALIRTQKRVSAKYYKPDAPQGIFLLLGPPATGKSETAEVLAEGLHGDRRKLIRINCTEFQNASDVAKLFGAPPGYLGHRETKPIITTEALNEARSKKSDLAILLFDEIEKAHPDVRQAILQILDKGKLTTGTNDRVDLTRTIILMTGNVGSRELERQRRDPYNLAAGSATAKPDQTAEGQFKIIQAALKKVFSPEFLDRVGKDNVLIFRDLTLEERHQIFDLQLTRVNKWILENLKGQAFSVSVSEAAKKFIVSQSPAAENGRGVRRGVDQYIIDPLSIFKVSDQISPLDVVSVEVKSGKDGKSRLVYKAKSLVSATEKELDPSLLGEKGERTKRLIEQKLIGQVAAKRAMISAYFRAISGLSDPTRPKGTFLFLGPPGTGKTEAAQVLAEAIHMNPDKMIRVNCTEYQLEHEISKILGAPPGYQGHSLTEGVFSEGNLRKYRGPNNEPVVILLDEIEKASPTFHQMLLQIMDKGQVRIGTNQVVDMSNVIFVATGNIGNQEVAAKKSPLGFGQVNEANKAAERASDEATVLAAVYKTFSPEFVNRVDKIVVFEELTLNQRKRIVAKMLSDLEIQVVRADDLKAYSFEATESAINRLIELGAGGSGRYFKELIDQNVTQRLSHLKASGQVNAGDHVIIDYKNNTWDLTIQIAKGAYLKTPPPAPAPIKEYDIADVYKTLIPIEAHSPEELQGVAMDNRGEMIAVLSKTGSLKVIGSSNPQKHRAVFALTNQAIQEFSFSSTGKLAFASGKTLVVLNRKQIESTWDNSHEPDLLTKETVPLAPSQGEERISRLYWSPNGEFLAVVMTDGKVHLVHAFTRTPFVAASAFDADLADEAKTARRVAFSPDSERVTISHSQEQIRVLKIGEVGSVPFVTPEEITSADKPVDSVYAGDGRFLVSLFENGLLQFRDGANPKQLYQELPLVLRGFEVAKFLTVSPDGRYLAVRIDFSVVNDVTRDKGYLLIIDLKKPNKYVKFPIENSAKIRFSGTTNMLVAINNLTASAEAYTMGDVPQLVFSERMGSPGRYGFEMTENGSAILILGHDGKSVTLYKP